MIQPATETPKKYLIQRDLLDRGWSRPAIDRVLGGPDYSTDRYGGGEIHYFEEGRVAAAEQSDAKWRKREAPTPQPIDILTAVVEVSRAAKRCRDAAQRHYQAGNHGFAGSQKRKKQALYNLKDQCVAHLCAEGMLRHIEYHRFGDRWASLVSTVDRPDVRLHVPCADPCLPGLVVEDLGDEIPARERKKIKVQDAEYTVRQYLKDRAVIETYRWPIPTRPVSVQECYQCGGPWIAGECLGGCGEQ